jgi:hypothetical protein
MEHITQALARAPLFAPPNDEAHSAPHAAGPTDQYQSQPDSASDLGDCKAFASLRARLKSQGYSLQRLSDHSLLVHRWNYSRPLADLSQAAAFLRQIGGAA